MKKYIAPISRSIVLVSESIIALSGGIYDEEDVNVMTNEQENNKSSLWDSWSE